MHTEATPDIGSLIKPSGAHSALYTDQAVFERELQRVFEENWVYVAHVSEFPRDGDYIRRTVGTQPVLVTRARDKFHVVVNRCAHRGNLLCMPERGRKRSFVCQYHGWAFAQNGDLVDIPYPSGCAHIDREKSGLRTARVEIYRGFIFASLKHDVAPLSEFLGLGAHALDRVSDLSPAGELDIGPTWVRHLFRANWKMMSENEADGYHVNFVHNSFARAIDQSGKYENILVDDESDVGAGCRYLGNGHTELEYESTYPAPLTWLRVKEDRYPEYFAAMCESYGEADAREILRRGPPHAFIFPNLFIAETCLVMIQPLSVGETVNWHTPLYLKDAPDEVNRRILRQGEVAMGPSSFLTADDAIIAERQWRAMRGAPGWLDLSRGEHRETVTNDGVVQSHYTDEVSNRGFWNHYKSLFAA